MNKFLITVTRDVGGIHFMWKGTLKESQFDWEKYRPHPHIWKQEDSLEGMELYSDIGHGLIALYDREHDLVKTGTHYVSMGDFVGLSTDTRTFLFKMKPECEFCYVKRHEI